MSSGAFSLGPFGAYTPQAAAAIQQQIANAGFGTTGNIYYLDPLNGIDGNSGATPYGIPGQTGTGAVKTLAAGYALLREGKNDVLVLIGNGLTTATARLTASFTWSKNAAHFVGICSGSWVSQRARIAPTTTVAGFANFFTVSGNGCYFANLQFFQGFGTGVAAEICMTVTGARNVFVNCSIDGMGDTSASAGAASTTSRNLLITAGENLFRHCSIGIDTIVRSVANASVEISGGSARNIFEDCIFPADVSSASAVHVLAAASSALDRYTLFKGCTFLNAIQSGATGQTGVFQLAASVGGMVFLQASWQIGASDWGIDATSKAQIYCGAPVGSGTGGVALVNT